MQVTRFAPSPTGLLHLGHAYAALFAARQAALSGGKFLIRMEDIDQTRSKEEYADRIYEDLEWLGMRWELPVRCQSDHFPDYLNAMERLKTLGLLYPCFCTRKEIQAEIARAGSAPHGPEGAIYPGTCKRLSADEIETRLQSGKDYALRLNMDKLMSRITTPLTWEDLNRGKFVADPRSMGDVVLARKDTPTSYHLAVVVDDAAQNITLVTRGEDLLFATHLHRVLQYVLDLPVPKWLHHELITDEKGQRLAKRDKARALSTLRAEGWTPQQVRNFLNIP